MPRIRGRGRSESQSQTALQRRASASTENSVAHSCRIRFGQPGNGLCDDQCRVLVGRKFVEPACYRRCRQVDRESDGDTQQPDGLSRAFFVRADGVRRVRDALDLLRARRRQQALCLPVRARQRRTYEYVYVRAADFEDARRGALDSAGGGRRRSISTAADLRPWSAATARCSTVPATRAAPR